MTLLKKIGLLFSFIYVVSIFNVFADDDDQRLFINLTSNEMNRAAMALTFSTNILMEKKIPVTIFLNVDGVKIADKNIREHTHASGKSLQQMLKDFIKAGGRVIICPMCMSNVGGLEKEDLIEGVEIGGPNVTWPALFADDTIVMSY